MSLKDAAKGAVKSGNGGNSGVQEKAMVPTKAEETAPAKINFSPAKFSQIKEDFISANASLGLDFVYIGQWLVVNKKGQFVERDAPEVKYGDSIDVVIGAGEERFTMWGKENSAEKGQLLIAEKTKEEAETKFHELMQNGAILTDDYTLDDIQSRYVAQVIPLSSLEENSPKIYVLSMSTTAKFAFGKWAYNLFSGKFAADGFPKGTSVQQIITRITTVEKSTDNFSYITMEFSAVRKIND